MYFVIDLNELIEAVKKSIEKNGESIGEDKFVFSGRCANSTAMMISRMLEIEEILKEVE